MSDPASIERDDQQDFKTDWSRAIREAAQDAVITINADGRVVDWSPQAETLFGYSREDAIDRFLSTLVIPERYRDAHAAGLERLRSTGEGRILNQRMEFCALRRDGHEFPIELTVTTLRIGSQPLYTAFVRPVRRFAPSARARMALESRLLHQVSTLSASAESFDEALQTCVEVMCSVTGWPIGHVFVPDESGEFLESTEIWHFKEKGRHSGIQESSQNLIFRRGAGLPGRIWETGEAIWSANIAQDERFTDQRVQELGIRGAFGFPVSVNGETVAVLEFFTPDEVTPDPQLLMLVSNIGTQLGRIIERRHWEVERTRLAAIVDSSYDAIIGKSSSGKIISWNMGAELIYGYTADEAVGEPISLILPEGVTEEDPEIRHAVKTGRRLTQFETRRRRKDGAEVVVAVTVSPIRDSKGRLIGASSIERDITQRIVRERELEAAKSAAEKLQRAAEAANRTKSEFLANISHELRTPMNAIIGMLELALGEDLDEGMHDYLDTARDSAHTLLYLLDDLLDFSRMEEGRFELEAEPFELRDVVDGVLKTLSLRASEKGLELATHVDPDVPNYLEGDGNRLRQILMNLAGNAVKFTEQGEILISVSVASCEADEVMLQFLVKDTGIGIAPKDHERIFAPFTQADASTTRRQSGSGLGLAISRELVSKMGGRIWLKSTLGRGTAFYFTSQFRTLPVSPAALTDDWDIQDLPVLVIDDNATNLAIIRDILTNWKMRPTIANSARQGLQQWRESFRTGHPFPVVIVDALMPDVDGFTLVETMQNEKLGGSATVLMVSSADRQTFQERCAGLRISAYLTKPISQGDLHQAIGTALSNRATVSPQAVQPIPKTMKPLRVLLAEDTPANQKVVRAMLEKRGHHVSIADNGREVLDRLRQDDFDVVLMDVQMPTMDGLQATAAIRQMADLHKANLPIIAMTAHARREDRRRCQNAGMDAYISKPIDLQRLITLVETTMRRPGAESAAQWVSDPQMEVMSPPLAPPPARSDASVFERDAALARMGGDEQLFASMARFFLDDSPGLIRQIRQGFQSSNPEVVTRAAHSLKGLAANFNAHAVCQVANRMEELSRGHNLQSASLELSPLIREVRNLQSALQPYAQSGDHR